ncbi:MAG: CAP domain-containing protein [Thermoleophilia bacterium]
MRSRTRPLLLALAALTLATAPAAAQNSPDQNRVSPAAIEKAVIKAMNAERVQRKRPALRGAAALTRAARRHSAYMARTGAFQHESENGAPFWTRLIGEGFSRNRRMAENIAMVPGCDAGTAAWVVQLWMESPGHRKNLLDGQLRVTGVGVAVVGDCDQVLVTADYGG